MSNFNKAVGVFIVGSLMSLALCLFAGAAGVPFAMPYIFFAFLPQLLGLVAAIAFIFAD